MTSATARYAVALEQPVSRRSRTTISGIRTGSPIGPSSPTITLTSSGVGRFTPTSSPASLLFHVDRACQLNRLAQHRASGLRSRPSDLLTGRPCLRISGKGRPALFAEPPRGVDSHAHTGAFHRHSTRRARLRSANGSVGTGTVKNRPEDCQATGCPLRPLFLVSLHAGLRWSEQSALQWQDVDLLSGTLTVARSKNGHQRTVPMNATVRSAFLDASLGRKSTDEPDERVFPMAYRTVARVFDRSVRAAQAALRDAGKDASLLEGYTWHCNRHTFASRLVMAGVDMLTVQKPGGWRTLSMVQRYEHLAPDPLRAAVERLTVTELGLGPSVDTPRIA
jgi:Phage integrase family